MNVFMLTESIYDTIEKKHIEMTPSVFETKKAAQACMLRSSELWKDKPNFQSVSDSRKFDHSWEYYTTKVQYTNEGETARQYRDYRVTEVEVRTL